MTATGHASSGRSLQADLPAPLPALRRPGCAHWDYVLNLGFSKSMTSSAAAYFRRLGYPNFKSNCNKYIVDMNTSAAAGEPVMTRVMARCAPPLMLPELDSFYLRGHNFAFQITHLSDLLANMPLNRTLFVFSLREPESWVRSVMDWFGLEGRL